MMYPQIIAMIESLTKERDEALKVRDLARDASNRDLEAKRRVEAENAALRQTLEEWRDHFGCEGPFNAYIQDGNSDPRTRVAAKAQERANQATNESAALRERVRVLTEALQRIAVNGNSGVRAQFIAQSALAAAPEPPANSEGKPCPVCGKPNCG